MVPFVLVLVQPDLGTALILAAPVIYEQLAGIVVTGLEQTEAVILQ